MNVRITGITIQNLKNVVFGNLSLENSKKAYKASVIGLYGQNGSGKTTFVDVIELLRYVLSGMSVPNKFADYINVDADFATLSYEFKIGMPQGIFSVTYKFDLLSVPDDTGQNIGLVSEYKRKILIQNEQFKCPFITERTIRTGKLIDTNCNDVFVPKSKMYLLIGKDNEINMLAAKKFTATSSRSFIFSREFLTLLHKRAENNKSQDFIFYASLLEGLAWFGNYNLFAINTLNSGLISLNTQTLIFRQDKEIRMLTLPIETPITIRHKDKELTEKIIKSINIVLKQIIPDLTIGIAELGTQLMPDGETGHVIQLMSRNNRIALKNESEGIKKIISILHLLIAVYNQPSITVAIDELDTGIFEYLLGEMLRIIFEKGKGQLIFTSHNLRPLETLDKDFVVFTTTNPEKRYIRMTNVKSDKNLRDFYYRDIMLGEQNEELYKPTNNAEIAFALREAGRV